MENIQNYTEVINEINQVSKMIVGEFQKISKELEDIKKELNSLKMSNGEQNKHWISTFEEFQAILKEVEASKGLKSHWRNGRVKPNLNALNFMQERGIPLHAWNDIELYIKTLKQESFKNLN